MCSSLLITGPDLKMIHPNLVHNCSVYWPFYSWGRKVILFCWTIIVVKSMNFIILTSLIGFLMKNYGAFTVRWCECKKWNECRGILINLDVNHPLTPIPHPHPFTFCTIYHGNFFKWCEYMLVKKSLVHYIVYAYIYACQIHVPVCQKMHYI